MIFIFGIDLSSNFIKFIVINMANPTTDLSVKLYITLMMALTNLYLHFCPDHS